MNPNQTYTQSDQPDDVDKGFSEAYKDQRHQEKVSQTQQQTSKRSESSHKSQSRPHSKAASISQQLRSRSNPRTNKSWISTNPFINFMYEFRKSQSGQRGASIFQLGGEEWRHMSVDEKQPFIEAANQNKKLKKQQQQSEQKKQEKQGSVDRKQYRTRSEKNKVANKKSDSSRKTVSPEKHKERQKHHKAEVKKRRAQSDSDTDTDTSGSIHDATTDCPSEDSDNDS